MNIIFLEKAITRLEEGLQRYQQNISDIQIRNGLINVLNLRMT